jgi:hypothetical protein
LSWSQAGFFTKLFSKAFPAVRNRLLSDPRFLFKVGAEVAIDAGQDYLLCMAIFVCKAFSNDENTS